MIIFHGIHIVVYKDLIISTIVDTLEPCYIVKVYKDLIISTIVDLAWRSAVLVLSIRT